MKCPNVRVVFDRKKRSAKTGKGKVEVVINFDRLSHKYILMGEVAPEQSEVFMKSTNVLEKVQECEKIITSLQLVKDDVTFDTFTKAYEDMHKAEFIKKNKNMFNGHDQNQSFINYMLDRINAENIKDGTRAHKLVVVEALKEYGKLRRFCDLTPDGILDFDDYLRHGKKTRSDYTIHHNYHKKIHQYTHELKVRGMIPDDPYDHIDSIPVGSNKERKPLSEKELIKVRNAKLAKNIIPTRDLFVFLAYTGLSYSDSQIFDFDTMTDEYDGVYYIDGNRVKTGCNFFTPILEPAMEVLKKYHFQLPKIDIHTVNTNLHTIEALLRINKSMTSHIGRHSFATMILCHDVPMENLSRMLGHKEIRTTQIYGKILKKNVVRFGKQVNKEIK